MHDENMSFLFLFGSACVLAYTLPIMPAYAYMIDDCVSQPSRWANLQSCLPVFAADATLLAVGDAAGTVSSWDVLQSCLVTAAQAHDGPVTAVNWLNSAGSENTNTLVSCGYDGAVATLQIDPGIYKLYRAAFWGLYHSCKRSHKVG